MKDLVCIYMTQVVAGPMSKFAFYSGQFSSCSPLFAFNSQTKMGAYYHVPGRNGTGNHEGDEEICRVIVHAVQPDHVWVFPPGDNRSAGASPFFRANVSGSDVDGLSRLLSSARVARNLKYSIEEGTKPYTGMLAYLDATGNVCFTKNKDKAGPYGNVYDPKKNRDRRPPGCGVKNWSIDLSNWVALS